LADELEPQTTDRHEIRVTDEARDTLERWGLKDEHIEGLVGLAGEYEYANPVGKAEAIAERGGFVMTYSELHKVVLPDLYDYTGQRRDGQCGEIAVNVIGAMHDGGWLESVNQSLDARGHKPLQPLYMHGQSPEFFRFGTHIWAGLVPEGADPKTEGLVVDGSFGTIERSIDSDYRTMGVIRDPEDAKRNTSAMVNVSKLTHIGDDVRMYFEGAAVLGMTTDRSLSVGIGFARDDQEHIAPFVRATDADGNHGEFMINADRELVRAPDYPPPTPEAGAEILGMLEALEGMQLEERPDARRDDADAWTTRQFKPTAGDSYA
jgi:hypothetical protein